MEYTPSKDGSRCLLLPHVQARAHTAAATLEANRVQLITQTPSSPGLAPDDFILLPRVKQKLKGKQFQGVEDARDFFDCAILDIQQSTSSAPMVSWFERIAKCVHVDEGYYENQD